MSHELVKVPPASVPAISTRQSLPMLVERAGGAARFAWDEFFYAEHHNPHTQRAYQSAVRRPEPVRGGGGRTDRHHAGHGWPVSRGPGRLAGEA